jgi:hypothetical protein
LLTATPTISKEQTGMAFTHDLEQIAELRARGQEQGWSIPQIVEAIVEQFGVTRLKAHRLARGWTRAKAVREILKTYDADGLARPSLTTQRLCAWEHDPRIRPGEEYLDRLCRVYETRPDLLGYGHDYSPPAQPAVCGTGDEPHAAYAGAPAASLAVAAGRNSDDGREAQPDGEETATTDRDEFLRGAGATGLAALLDRASKAPARLSRKLGASNLGPVTVEQLELRVVSLAQGFDQTPPGQLFRQVLAEQEEVEALLDGRQPLRQRRGLYRIAGQLSLLLGSLSFNLGDYPAARAHLLTAWQLAEEVGDHTLCYRTRVEQSTVALWAGDFHAARDFAQDGRRYATTGAMEARLAVRCEARAHARMNNQIGVKSALQRAERVMPTQLASEEPDGWWVFLPGDLELYTGMSLLWLGESKQAEPHAREAMASYQAAPLALQSPFDQAQAQINLAICLSARTSPTRASGWLPRPLAPVGRPNPTSSRPASFLQR